MPLRLFFVVLIYGMLTSPAQAAPSRIVSLNVCADQYIIALADRDQVAALTVLSRDPTLSYFADRAKSYPVTGSSIEEILRLEADLIVISPLWRAESQAVLEQFSLPILKLGTAQSFDDIVRQTRMIADAVGHRDRGDELVRQMQADLEEMDVADAADGPTVLNYQRRGYLTGSRTLMSEVMLRAGLVNMAGALDTHSIRRVSLETLLLAQPDYLLIGVPLGQVEDLGTELLDHPALRRFYGPGKRLYVPQALTVCGGPSFVPAVRSLRRQLEE